MSDTRNTILDSAQMLFTQKGYDATSMDLIAKEVGFTKAALYYHFKSKEDILLEIMKRTTENAVSHIGGIESLNTISINNENLKAYLLKLFNFLIQEKEVFSIALVEFLKENQQNESLMLKIPSQFLSHFENIISISEEDRAIILFHVFSFILFESLSEKISNELNMSKVTLEEHIKNYTISLLTAYVLENSANKQG